MLGYSLNKLMGQYSNTFRLNMFSYLSMMPTKTMVAHEKIWRDLNQVHRLKWRTGFCYNLHFNLVEIYIHICISVCAVESVNMMSPKLVMKMEGALQLVYYPFFSSVTICPWFVGSL